jgi:hypothetical protein
MRVRRFRGALQQLGVRFQRGRVPDRFNLEPTHDDQPDQPKIPFTALIF